MKKIVQIVLIFEIRRVILSEEMQKRCKISIFVRIQQTFLRNFAFIRKNELNKKCENYAKFQEKKNSVKNINVLAVTISHAKNL